VIRDLEEGRGREEAVRSLRDEVEDLRRDMVGLREKLVKLESSNGGNGDGASKEKAAKPAAPATKTKAAKPAPKGKRK